jgi:hypothetical protein
MAELSEVTASQEVYPIKKALFELRDRLASFSGKLLF